MKSSLANSSLRGSSKVDKIITRTTINNFSQYNLNPIIIRKQVFPPIPSKPTATLAHLSSTTTSIVAVARPRTTETNVNCGTIAWNTPSTAQCLAIDPKEEGTTRKCHDITYTFAITISSKRHLHNDYHTHWCVKWSSKHRIQHAMKQQRLCLHRLTTSAGGLAKANFDPQDDQRAGLECMSEIAGMIEWLSLFDQLVDINSIFNANSEANRLNSSIGAPYQFSFPSISPFF